MTHHRMRPRPGTRSFAGGATVACPSCRATIDTNDAGTTEQLPDGLRFLGVACQCGKSYTVEMTKVPEPATPSDGVTWTTGDYDAGRDLGVLRGIVTAIPRFTEGASGDGDIDAHAEADRHAARFEAPPSEVVGADGSRAAMADDCTWTLQDPAVAAAVMEILKGARTHANHHLKAIITLEGGENAALGINRADEDDGAANDAIQARAAITLLNDSLPAHDPAKITMEMVDDARAAADRIESEWGIEEGDPGPATALRMVADVLASYLPPRTPDVG